MALSIDRTMRSYGMRATVFTVLVVLCLGIAPAPAVDLKPCTGSDKSKIACLEKQLEAVNSALEALIRRTETEGRELTTRLTTFAQRFDIATSNSVKYEERIILKLDESNECLTWVGKEAELKSRGCPTYLNAMKWRVKRE
jgi:DNA-binding transcriptional regulator GbsR (MarR family)